MNKITLFILLLIAATTNGQTGRMPLIIGTGASHAPANAWDHFYTPAGSILSMDDTVATGQAARCGIATPGVSSGKYYWEVASNGAGYPIVGIAKLSVYLYDQLASAVRPPGESYGYVASDGSFTGSGGVGNIPGYGITYFAAPITIGIALDMDNGALYFSYENIWQNGGVPTSGAAMTGAAVTGLTGTWYPAWGFESSGGGNLIGRFIYSSLKYFPPAGYTVIY